MTTWIDTPWLLDPGTVRSRGYTGVMRYICSDWNTGPGTSMPNKRISRAELDAYIAAGVDVGVNFEDAADDYTGGYNRGKAKGQTAGAWMLATLDCPPGMSCCTSLDADVGSTWGGLAQAYQRGFADGLTSEGPYVPGVYGAAVALNGARADGTAHVFWLTAATSWGHGQTAAVVHLRQNGYWPYGSEADLNYTVTQPMGSYLQTLKGDVVTPEDVAAVANAAANAVWSHLLTPNGTAQAHLVDTHTAVGSTSAKVSALQTAVGLIPTLPVDQAGLERAVVDAITQALAGGVPVGTVQAEVTAALAQAQIPVTLTGTAGTVPTPVTP